MFQCSLTTFNYIYTTLIILLQFNLKALCYLLGKDEISFLRFNINSVLHKQCVGVCARDFDFEKV